MSSSDSTDSSSTISRLQPHGEVACAIEHIRDPATHTGREVTPGQAENDDATTGHVFTTMISKSLDHRGSSAVSHRKSLGGPTAEIGFTHGGTIQANVTHLECSDRPRTSSREVDTRSSVHRTSLCQRSHWRPLQFQGNAMRQEGPKLWPAEPRN